MFLPHPLVKLSIVGSLRDREVASSASDLQGLNFKSCVWRSSHSSHHPQEVLLAKFSLYVHKSGLNPDHFIFYCDCWSLSRCIKYVLHYVAHNSYIWNESGFRPPLCTYMLNWARRNSWGWWDDWDDTVLQTQDSKFEPWRSEAEHATSRSRRLPTKLPFTRGWGRNIFVSFKPPRPRTEPRTLAWRAAC